MGCFENNHIAPRVNAKSTTIRTFSISHCRTRRIVTSVAFIRVRSVVCPGFSCISRAEAAVMMDVTVLAADDFRYYEGE